MRSVSDPYALRSVEDIPASFRSTFGFRYFNSLQSECFSGCFLSDINMVISAPTGSGKTVLFELSILRLLSRFLSPKGNFNHIQGTLKTIYIAPSKALVQEKLRDWKLKLGSWGINCLEMTGDNESYTKRNIHEADIILTTPEKFDAVSRHGINEGRLSFFSDIALVLIDEVHLLSDPRGATLEAIVSRIKMLSLSPKLKTSCLANVRLVAVSATIPNIEDLAEWLMVPFEGIKRFGEEMRPVKLTTKVFGYAPARNDFLFERRLQNFIFVGYHNGGLCLKDRNLIEDLFFKGDLQILCTTNTLAHGINLPAHTVVIKSTQYFNKEKGRYMEYERSMVLQMCGRAGRPPFDDNGTVIIMTRRETVHLYENFLNGCEMVESQLLSSIMEHLNAEIVQLTVSDISMAIEWLKCSYLYVRLKKNPEKYGVKKNIPHDCLEKHMQEICVQNISELSKHGMIWTDDDGFLLKPLEPGKLMAKYYLKFNTMKGILHAPESYSLEDLLHLICHSEEISWIQLRRNEKKILNDVNFDKEARLRFHVVGENGKLKRRIQTREEKIFVLANDCLTGDPLIHDLSLSQDTNSICSNGCRIAKCMKECFIYRKSYKGAINSSLLANCLYQRLWENSSYLLKQLHGIGMVTAKALLSAGITSFESMAEADPRKIEIITGRKYPFGNHIKESLSSLPPKINMSIDEVECKRQGKTKLLVTLTRASELISSSKLHYSDLVVGSEEDNLVLFHEKLRAEEFPSPYKVNVLVSCPQGGKLTVKANLIFEEYVGVDIHEEHVITRNIGSVATQAHRNRDCPSGCSLPKEIRVIKDEKSTNTNVQTEIPWNQSSSKRTSLSMPSFDLPTEDEECEAITEETVFKHIRKKSKNLPVLMTSNSMDFSYDPLIWRRICTANARSNPDVSEYYQKKKNLAEQEQSQTSVEYGTNASSSYSKNCPLPDVEADGFSFYVTRDKWKGSANKQQDTYVDQKDSKKQSSCNMLSLKENSEVDWTGAPFVSSTTPNDHSSKVTEAKKKQEVPPFMGFKSVFSFL